MLSVITNTANADSTIATITVDAGPYGAVFDPDNGYIYTANVLSNSLEAPLNAAVKQLNRENDVPACNLLNSFLDQVNSKETNGQLTSQQAANLRQQALSIQHTLGCSSAGQGGSSDDTDAGGADGDIAGDGRGSNVLPLPH
jgi:hypothetical protein